MQMSQKSLRDGLNQNGNKIVIKVVIWRVYNRQEVLVVCYQIKDRKQKYIHEHLEERIMEHEGFIPKIYKDTRGLATIGYGHLVTKQDPFIEDVEYPEEELYESFFKRFTKSKKRSRRNCRTYKRITPYCERNYNRNGISAWRYRR